MRSGPEVPFRPRRPLGAVLFKTRRGPIGGPPREVAQLSQDSAAYSKTVPFCSRRKQAR